MQKQGFVTGNKDYYWFKPESVLYIDDLYQSSEKQPILFFKHSTRCSISVMVLSRFEKNWNLSLNDCQLYLIDVLEQRPISNYLSELTKTEHQSPQAILLFQKKVVYIESHTAINVDDITQEIAKIP